MPRNRSLAQVGAVLDPEQPTRLHDTLRDRPGVCVLEIGFGEGRALLELAAEFPKSRSFGVDAALKGPVNEVREGQVANALHFGDETFDLVYSAVVIRFIADKARVIADVCRVLKPGGVAILDVDDIWTTDPVFSRFQLRSGDGLPLVEAYLNDVGGDAFTFRVIHSTRLVLEILKHDAAQLDLDLRYDSASSLPRDRMPIDPRTQRPIGGRRSVYEVRSCGESAADPHVDARPA